MAYKTYRFKAGDSLPKVAEQFGVTSQQLMKANQGLYRPTAGTTVRVPTPQPITGGRYSPAPAGTLGGKSTLPNGQIPFAAGVSSNPYINPTTSANLFSGVPQNYPPARDPYGMPQSIFMSQFPSQGTIAATPRTGGFATPKTIVASVSAKAGSDNDFPGFWGGGKNGQFYKSLREARIATRRRQQMKGLGQEVAQVDPKTTINNGQTSDYSLTWRVG